MKLIEVETDKQARQFISMAPKLYEGDPNYIRPSDSDIEFVFDRSKNGGFRKGDANRWLLENSSGEIIGRVAAFYEKAELKNEDLKPGGMGFFECIDDQNAANMLFDKCKEWLAEKGFNAMDGPINFGDKRAWWGVQIDGFAPPTYRMNYNPPYYPKLFRNYGFKTYYQQLVYARNILEPVQDNFQEKYKKLMKEPGYSFRHIEKSKWKDYARDFMEVYNGAWGSHPGFQPLKYDIVLKGFKTMRPIMVDYLMWFAYHNDKPIAFFIMIPDLNQIIKNFNGKFGLWEKIKLKWHIMTDTYSKCYGQIFGVVKEYQGKGVEGAIVEAASHVIHPKNHYNEMEMTWIGDFNPKMVHVCESVGGILYKTYETMRYLFDRERKFERHPIVGVNKKEKDKEEKTA